jgi:hypothetical protein
MDCDRCTSPREPYLTDWAQERSNADDADRCFGVDSPSFWVLGVGIDESSGEGLCGNGNNCANTNADERQTSKSLRPTAESGVDQRIPVYVLAHRKI